MSESIHLTGEQWRKLHDLLELPDPNPLKEIEFCLLDDNDPCEPGKLLVFVTWTSGFNEWEWSEDDRDWVQNYPRI